MPPYEYFEHDADIGVAGRGTTVEEAFEAAAEATFAIIAEPDSVKETKEIAVAFVEDDVELALVQWLNALIGAATEQGLALRRFVLSREGSRWCGRAWGEPWGERADRGVEVKGATLTMLSVKPGAKGWEARCVVDV